MRRAEENRSDGPNSVCAIGKVTDGVHALHSSGIMLEKTHTSSLTKAEVLDRVLDKGIVIDSLSHVSVAGTELVTIYSQVVVASIETYLKYFGELPGVAKVRPARRKTHARTSRSAARVVDFPAVLPD